MAFLTICGIDPLVGIGTCTVRPEPMGAGAGVTRAANMSARANHQGVRQRLKAKTAPIAMDAAFFLEVLLSKLADRWSWDAGLFSDKGMTASSSAGVTPGTTTAPLKYGAGYLAIALGGANQVTNPVPVSPAGWTVLVWRLEAGTWFHYIVSGTAVWKNGVAQAPGLPAWLVVDAVNGTAQLKGNAGAADAFDDLVFIPAAMPAAPNGQTYGTGLYTFHAAQAWPLAWKVVCAGDFHPAALTMLCDAAPDSEVLTGALSGQAYADNLRRLSFEIVEG